MRGTAFWGSVVTAAFVAGCGLPGLPATPGGPGHGPHDPTTVVVTATVSGSCDGGAPTDISFDLTVPTFVRAGRPFPVEIDAREPALPQHVAAYVGLSITGVTAPDVTIALHGPTYLVATSAPNQDVTLTITRFGVTDPVQAFIATCVVDAPSAAATIRVRHPTPFAEGQIGADQRVGVLCRTFPGGRGSLTTQDVSISVPNKVRAGQPFTIDAPGVDVVRGVRSGDTVTPTGAVGETVDFSFDASFTEFAPPPLPPVPVNVCEQQGGRVHLASVPIIAG